MKNAYETVGDDVWIRLSGRAWWTQQCVINLRDLPVVARFPGTWRANAARGSATKFYAQIKVWDRERQCSRTVLMHRLILKTPRGMDSHHVDNDGLNNRRLNLEVKTHLGNMRAGKPEEHWDALDTARAARAENARVLAICRRIRKETGLTRQMVWAVREGKKRSQAVEMLLREYGLWPALEAPARRPQETWTGVPKEVAGFARHIPCVVCGRARCTEPHPAYPEKAVMVPETGGGEIKNQVLRKAE